MGMNIKDEDAHALAREIARIEGVSLTEAVKSALRDKLERVKLRRAKAMRPLAERLDEIAARCASLPDIDKRSPEEIIGYDEHGVPR